MWIWPPEGLFRRQRSVCRVCIARGRRITRHKHQATSHGNPAPRGLFPVKSPEPAFCDGAMVRSLTAATLSMPCCLANDSAVAASPPVNIAAECGANDDLAGTKASSGRGEVRRVSDGD